MVPLLNTIRQALESDFAQLPRACLELEALVEDVDMSHAVADALRSNAALQQAVRATVSLTLHPDEAVDDDAPDASAPLTGFRNYHLCVARTMAYQALRRRNDVDRVLSALSHGVADGEWPALIKFHEAVAHSATLHEVHRAACARLRAAAAPDTALHVSSDALLYHNLEAAVEPVSLRRDDPLLYKGGLGTQPLEYDGYSPEVCMLRHLAEMCAAADNVPNGVDAMRVCLHTALSVLESDVADNPPVREKFSIADVCEDVEEYMRTYGCSLPSFAPLCLLRPLEKLSAIVHLVVGEDLTLVRSRSRDVASQIYTDDGAPHGINAVLLNEALMGTPAGPFFMKTLSGSPQREFADVKVNPVFAQTAWSYEHGAMRMFLDRQCAIAARVGLLQGEPVENLKNTAVALLMKLDDTCALPPGSKAQHNALKRLQEVTAFFGVSPQLDNPREELLLGSSATSCSISAVLVRRCCGSFRLIFRDTAETGGVVFTPEVQSQMKAKCAREMHTRFLSAESRPVQEGTKALPAGAIHWA